MTSETTSIPLKVVVMVSKHYHLPRDNHGLTSESDLECYALQGYNFRVRTFPTYSLILIDEIRGFLQSCKSYIKIISKLLSAPVDFLKKLSYSKSNKNNDNI